jgi:gamma-aminobutyric acid type B receptor
MFWALCQAIALGIARKQSELKSASVFFSLLAVIGVFSILLAPLLIAQDDVSVSHCGASVWFLCLGFTLCYGSLFAKLFRLYTIFTSRKLVVPRLSNKKLLAIVCFLLVIDFILVLSYAIVTPPEPFVFSRFVRSSMDLATGYREYSLQMCSFHVDSPALYIIIIFKSLIALGGAAMAFFIRQVDRRFSATSALGWAFYNMFLTVIIVIIISVQFDTNNNSLDAALFIPVFGGLWIMLVTLCALTLDSNVLLACQDLSKPVRRLLNGKNSKDSKEPKKLSNEAEPGDSKRSNMSTVFVVNREMFPTKYEDFENGLLEKILEELNFQRAAVRRALLPSSSSTTTTVEPRESKKFDSRVTSNSKCGLVPLNARNSSAISETPTTTYATLTVSVDPPSDTLPEPLDMVKTSSDKSETPPTPYERLTVSVDRQSDALPEPLGMVQTDSDKLTAQKSD